ncbi:MAG: hypothetical protein SW833_15685 [Cyanobacteriota bacterium]|nr:hypothetical protein [Cyanobacteriota bacterium]
MTTEPNIPKERALVEVSEETHALVEKEMPQESDAIKQETMALVETIKRKAQVEAQKAGELTRDGYLEAVRKVREEVESTNLFDRDRIAASVQLMQEDMEKNWESLVGEASVLGDRLSSAAQAAWDALTAPRSDLD